MKRTNTRAAVIALSGVVAVTAAACGGGGSTATSTGSGTSAAAATKGGTLYYLTKRRRRAPGTPSGPTSARTSPTSRRMVYRTLTTFPVASGKESTKLVADLATDTGTPSDGGKTWKFTLKDGAKWQDGKAVTCDDFKYGISRTFATDVITGGPNYAIQFLDIPKDAKGASGLQGPLPRRQGQAAFDKAVTCAGNTITFNLKQAGRDFNYARRLPRLRAVPQGPGQGRQVQLRGLLQRPVQAAGHVDQEQGRHVRPQPQLGPEDGHRSARPTRTRSSSPRA